MTIKHTIYCPNCGDRAERYECSESNIIRTSCSYCDYLMVQCSCTGKVKVIEAYAPGIAGYSPLSRYEMNEAVRKQHLPLSHGNSVC